jgi:hydrophobe/amphiphile efflux-3 (HAE3) family protein
MAISGFTAKNSRVILAFALIVIVFGAYANTQIKLETDTKKYFPQDIPAMIRFKELERVVGGQYPFVVVLSVDEVNSKTLKEVDELAKYVVGREDLVYDYSSLSSLVKRFAGDIPSDDKLNYVMSQIPEEELKKYVSGNLLAIYFKTNADTHDKRVELWDSLDKDIRFFGFSDYYITGNTVVMTEVGKLMLGSQLIMTLVAYGLIVILLFGVYRSLTRAVTPLLAITTVIGVVNTYMFLFGIKQTMISLALNSITLGLGIDFSIHITERYFEERRNFSPIESVRRTIERTGKAIVTSALTMAGGFGALAFSSFPALRDFGILSLIAIIFSLISALTVVPAFLMTTEKFRVNLNKLGEVMKNNVKA